MGVVGYKLQTTDGSEGTPDPYSLQAILSSVLETAEGLIPADAYAVWLLDVPSDTWKIVASRGLSEQYSGKTLSNDHYQLTSEPIYAEDVGSSPMLEFRGELYQREGIRSLMATPLTIRDRQRGTLVFYFRQPHRFTPVEIERSASLARLTGSALATAELYHEQLRAKMRSDFLAQASAALASSLEYEKALSSLASLAVPFLADWCTVDILQADNTLNRIAAAHLDSHKTALLREMSRKYPPSLSPDNSYGRVISSGRSELHGLVTDAMLQRAARSAEHYEMLRNVGARSVLVAPLKARNAIVGALTFATTAESGRQLDESAREVAEDLALRAGAALDNARLFGALQQSEQKFRAISEAAACAVFIFDGAKFLYANRAAEQLIGYTLHQFGDADMWQLVHSSDREVVKQRALSQLAGERTVLRQEVRVLRRNGKLLWLDVTSSPISYGGGTVLIATGFDITERKIATAQLERRELEARTLLNSIPDYIARFDQELRYIYKSSQAEPSSAVPASHYIGKTCRDLGLPDATVQVWENSLRQAFQTGKPNTVEYSLAGLDGLMRHYVGVASPEVNRSGHVESVMTITRDVTDQRNAAERLQQSEAQLRLIIDSMPGLVAYIDRNEIFRRVNRTIDEWYGAPPHAVVGRPVRDVVGRGNYGRIAGNLRRALQGEAVQYETVNEYNNTSRHVLITYVPDIDQAQQVRGIVALVMDVTEQRRAEEAMRKTEKLAAAGRLAASIAHEINNPLESVTNLLFLLGRESQLSESGRQYLLMAEQELKRVGHIATQTLRFHRQSTRPVLTNIDEVVDAVEGLYHRRLLASSIRFEKRYAAKEPINVMEGEIRQLIANLIGNALDATPSGGRILVRTRAAAKADGRQGVQITIADTGHGIPPELVGKIFEPFVTTKANTGTGLGLWVSREIVEKHRGSMQVRSRANGASTGTVFTVFVADLAP